MRVATRAVRMGPTTVEWERRPDGVLLLRSPLPLAPWPARITDWLVHWAERVPERLLLAQRDAGGGWRKLSYGQALEGARAVGQALIARGLSRERPVAVLSGNDLEHALLQLGALMVGVPYAPVSPAYSLLSKDYAKLRHVLDLLTPGLVFAADGDGFAAAIAAVMPRNTELVLAGAIVGDVIAHRRVELLPGGGGFHSLKASPAS